MRIYNEDNIKTLKNLEPNSVDSVITDPPYGLSFMNKKWDYQVPSIDFWKEVYRVLKPGGHILSFGGTRTYHRMVVNIEDAGFEIRDQIMWIYGSGFPKSLNIGKAVDKFGGNNLLSTEIGNKLKEARIKRGLTLKAADDLFCNGTSNYNWLEGRSDGQRIPNQELFDKIVQEWPELKDLRDAVVETERELLGEVITNKTIMKNIGYKNESGLYKKTKGQSEWEGFGTALKPANEPIVLARKPLSEKTVAENVMRWRTGGLNIDGCRVEYTSEFDKETAKPGSLNATGENSMFGLKSGNEQNETGRFPANVILECICDEVIKGENGKFRMRSKINGDVINLISYKIGAFVENYDYNDKGDIHTNPDCPCYMLNKQSGYLKSGEVKPHHKKNKTTYKFYTTNSYSKIENKDTTLKGYGDGGGASRFFYVAKVSKRERNFGLDDITNNHPTVKPITLLTYLCRLITPEKGIILDPFMGSGSTGVAALLEGFDFIGMELEKDYYDIAEQRIKNYELYKKIIK